MIDNRRAPSLTDCRVARHRAFYADYQCEKLPFTTHQREHNGGLWRDKLVFINIVIPDLLLQLCSWFRGSRHAFQIPFRVQNKIPPRDKNKNHTPVPNQKPPLRVQSKKTLTRASPSPESTCFAAAYARPQPTCPGANIPHLGDPACSQKVPPLPLGPQFQPRGAADDTKRPAVFPKTSFLLLRLSRHHSFHWKRHLPHAIIFPAFIDLQINPRLLYVPCALVDVCGRPGAS